MSTEPPEKKSPWQHVKSWPLSAKIAVAAMAAVLLLAVGGVIGAGSSGLSADGESGNERACKLAVGHYASMNEDAIAGNAEGLQQSTSELAGVLDDSLEEASGEIRSELADARDAVPAMEARTGGNDQLVFFLAMDRVDQLCESEAGVDIDVPQP